MSSNAREILGRLSELGCRVTAQGGTLRLEVVAMLPADLLEAARAHKPDLLKLLEERQCLRAEPFGTARESPLGTLRAAYQRTFMLTVAEADGVAVPPGAGEALYQEILRLTDEVGPVVAETLMREAQQAFEQRTGRCGFCGGRDHRGNA